MSELSELGPVIKTAYEAQDDTNAYTDTEKAKLGGIANGATANSSDASLLSRTNHSGQQAASTISDFAAAADSRIAAQKGTANGLVPLGGDSKIASSYLPSYIDDVLEAANYAALPATGETGKIYVTLDTNFEYRWSGSAYIQLVASPGSTDAVTEGATNKYFTAARTRAVQLATLTLSNLAILVNDTYEAMFGKLQAQINAIIASLGAPVQPRVSPNITDAATVTPNANLYDINVVPALSQDTTIANPTVTTPYTGQTFELWIKTTATRTLTYGTAYRGSDDTPLILATTAAKWICLKFRYSAIDSKWDFIAQNKGF